MPNATQPIFHVDAGIPGAFCLCWKTTFSRHRELCLENRKNQSYSYERFGRHFKISLILNAKLESLYYALCLRKDWPVIPPATSIIKFLIPSCQSIGLWFHDPSFFLFPLSPRITSVSRFYWCPNLATTRRCLHPRRRVVNNSHLSPTVFYQWRCQTPLNFPLQQWWVVRHILRESGRPLGAMD